MADWFDPPKHAKQFVEKGYCVVQAKDRALIDKARALLVAGLRGSIDGGGDYGDDESYLNNFHRFAPLEKLNDIRVKVHREVCGTEEFRKLLFFAVKDQLIDLIGGEIAMQRQVNFVTHLPGDKANLLYLHTDAWAGCSPYEVILWMPMVHVYGTKSMYICQRNPNTRHLAELKQGLKLKSAAELLGKIRPDIAPLEMKFGEALLFSPTLLHGAEENTTDETRFIFNVRFKSLFSPYGTKALGETFAPLNYLPATEVGLDYESEFGVTGG